MQRTKLTSKQIVDLRPPRNGLPDPKVVAGVQDEWEPDGRGGQAATRTVFLTGGECRFRCLMCDLWQYTIPTATAAGSLIDQLQPGLATPCSLPSAGQLERLKLYNGSNFFDPRNVPREDLPAIAKLCSGFGSIIVENHPKLLRPEIFQFRDSIDGRLEIAMGLETVYPEVLASLNKQMQIEDFGHACETLIESDVDIRAFILLGIPWVSPEEAVQWCVQSAKYAIDCGVGHISLIPMRRGNGATDKLIASGELVLPNALACETAFDGSLSLLSRSNEQSPNSARRPVVTFDLWDWDRISGTCPKCSHNRQQRLHNMNLSQQFAPRVKCEVCTR